MREASSMIGFESTTSPPSAKTGIESKSLVASIKLKSMASL